MAIRMAQQRWLTGHVDPATICGKPHFAPGAMHPSYGTAWDFCAAPAGTPHSDHPLAHCFRRATPCQVLLLAPFKPGPGECLADTLDYFLERLQLSIAYWNDLLERPTKPSKETLDYWT